MSKLHLDLLPLASQTLDLPHPSQLSYNFWLLCQKLTLHRCALTNWYRKQKYFGPQVWASFPKKIILSGSMNQHAQRWPLISAAVCLRENRSSRKANFCPSPSLSRSSRAWRFARIHSWGQIGRATEVQGQTAGLVGDVCWGLEGRGDGECNELRERGSRQENAPRARRWMNINSQRAGEFSFFCRSQTPFLYQAIQT